MAEAARRLVEDVKLVEKSLDEQAASRLSARSNADDKEPAIVGQQSAATVLVGMAQELYEFGVSTLGETYAIPKSGSKCVAMLRGNKTSLRNQLARAYFTKHRRAAPQQALADALLVVEGIAQEQTERELFLRVANTDGQLWLDIGDTSGKAIKITKDRWTVEDSPPILFKRTALNGSLPNPERGGDLDELWNLVNITEADRPLIAAWLVAALFQNIPHPVLSLFGEQGTGKTTAHKIIVNTLDPGPVPTRQPPRDSDSWVTAASGSWVVGMDNLSTVPPWLSDSICRAVTGDGDVRRKLYTDGEYSVFAFRRCICLNGIDLGATRGDLAERMLPISLDRIPDNKRVAENEIWPKWDEHSATILGAVLDLAVLVLNAIPSVELTSMPRMADFAKILSAVDQVLGTKGLTHYQDKQKTLAADSLTGDPFTFAVMQMQSAFEGTSSALLGKLTPEKTIRAWPKSARAATTLLRRAAPAMIKLGWEVTDDGGHNKQKITEWKLTPPPEITRNSSPPSPLPREKARNGGLAGLAGNKYEISQDDPCGKCLGEGCACCEELIL